jgi:hypothetical protein
MAYSPICSVQECGKPHRSRGFCFMHYQRFKKHGDPLGGRVPNGDTLKFYNDVVLQYEGDECLIWPFPVGKDGYARMRYNGKSVVVSRLLCEDVNGTPPTSKHDAAHSCGKGHEGCVTKGHLSWKTRAENLADKLIHGTYTRGEEHPSSRLTEAEAMEILSLKGRESQQAIANRYGVAQGTVSRIHRGEGWSHLQP